MVSYASYVSAVFNILQGRTRFGVHPHPWRERLLSRPHGSFREGIREEYGEDAVKLMDLLASKLRVR